MKYLLIGTFIFTFSVSYAQEIKVGKIKKNHFEITLTEEQKSAPSVILFENRRTEIDYEGDDGWIFKTQVHKVIQVNSKEGLLWGNQNILLYKDEADIEKVKGIHGVTYNLEDGKITKSKIKKSEVLKNQLNDNWIEYIIVGQNVKKGSIVEFYYEIESPFWKIDNLDYQTRIPNLHYKAHIKIPQFFGFNIYKRGYVNIAERQETNKKTTVFTYTTKTSNGAVMSTAASNHASMKIDVNELFYEATNIPALIKEPYLDAISNYQSSVIFELNSVNFPNQYPKYYSINWTDVAKKMFSDRNFGQRLSKKYFLDEVLLEIRKNKKPHHTIEEAIFYFVQNHFTWNGKVGKYIRRPLKNVYEKREGSASEINGVLLLLYDLAKIKAYPILSSTKEHGITMYPSLEGLNYMLVHVSSQGKYVSIDATNKNTKFGLLSEHLLNGDGIEIRPEGKTRKVSLTTKDFSVTKEKCMYSFDENSKIVGSYSAQYSNHHNLDYIGNNGSVIKSQLEEHRLNKNGLNELDNYHNQINKEGKSKENWDFSSDNHMEIVSNKILLTPLLFMSDNTNPYKESSRTYPLDLGYKSRVIKEIEFDVPEGYMVNSIPKNVKINFGQQDAYYSYTIEEGEAKIKLKVGLQFNKKTILPIQYNDLKEFYNRIIKKESELIILSKI